MADNVNVGKVSWMIKTSVEKASEQIKKLTANISGLKKTLSSVGFSGFISKIKQLGSSLSNFTNKMRDSIQISKFQKAINALNFGGVVMGIRQASNSIFNFVNKTSDYISTLNQFNTVMGESAETANDFIKQAENLLGLDPSQMMNSFATFKSLADGFGIAGEEAYKMSKNLTQLAVDMSAFKNISFDLALEKLKSGISGKIICLICKGLHIVTHLIAGKSKHVMV